MDFANRTGFSSTNGVTTESLVTKRFRESLLTSKLHVLQQGQEGLEIHLKVK